MNRTRLAAILALAAYLSTGFYIVQGNEKGAVRRFGQVVTTPLGGVALKGSGLHYDLPWPFSQVDRINLNEIRTLSVGVAELDDVSTGAFLRAYEASDRSQFLTGDKNILLIILVLSILTALYTAFAMIRGNHSRIETLREDVIHQFMGFARIWASEEHQKRIAEACTPSRDLKPVTFAVVVPVYGTLDLLVEDWRRWRRKRSRGAA
jgi:hypothetical protein